ncbi:NAD(P)H-quinone oxidoreductase [Bartonella tamiae]|uniref:Enoyl reductase (ER) domain-containing protein n=1 Tax=Bartonella tamiae Th239 TaxID=1094558 RepID=J0R003_9HYPH|nr:hypothetical protein ME5_00140 [Bartonella tamiae Th239]EJF92571.1 hypothetical protein MEG_01741 [Bartonella tamiae Th307]
MIIPKMMRAISIRGAGGPEVLKQVHMPVPSIKDDEILIQIHAAGVNRPDVAQRQGTYPPPPDASPLPGLEVAGKVVNIGKNVSRFHCGDHVTALVAGGGYAEYVSVASSNALPVPKGFNFIQAAALPETFFTVWSNVFDRGKLQSGDVFLVHGGTSGIGTTAIQLAKAFGAKVIATAGSKQKCDACLKLGADLAINYRERDFVEDIQNYTDKKGVNVILDMVGGDYAEKNYKIAANDAHIVQIAVLNGAKANVNLGYLMVKRLIHTGSTLRIRDTAFKADIAKSLYQKVWPLLEEGKITPIIDQVFSLNDVEKAHERMETSKHIGKIILKIV